jgi:hypothetical protein
MRLGSPKSAQIFRSIHHLENMLTYHDFCRGYQDHVRELPFGIIPRAYSLRELQLCLIDGVLT